MKRIAALLLSLLICISMIAYTEGNDAVVVDIMEQFDILGVSIERDKITTEKLKCFCNKLSKHLKSIHLIFAKQTGSSLQLYWSV